MSDDCSVVTGLGDSIQAPTAAARELAEPPPRPALRPIPRWVIAAGVPAMMAVAAGAAWLLLGRGVTRDQLDALRTAGALGIGFGGAVGLWLAVRRQRSTELDLLQKYEAHELAVRVAEQNQAATDRAAAHAEHDARERRLTELYLKAVEQLGSDKAAVRHGGLYALERVAQNNPDQRQTIVDVVCAYLRAPYTPPGMPTGRKLGVRRPLPASPVTRAAPARSARSAPPAPAWSRDDDARQEREVRLTAQRLLTRHLRSGDENHPVATFWDGISLDLTGATLIDFDLQHCRVDDGRFAGTRFTGETTFDRAKFARDAGFAGASFTGHAWFAGTRFAGDTRFDGARFTEYTMFRKAKFAGHAGFAKAEFAEDADFEDTEFAGETRFDDVKFDADTNFTRAKFTAETWYDRARFAGEADFGAAEFARSVGFDDARFDDDAWFSGSKFAGFTRFDNARFAGDTDFAGVRFAGETRFTRTEFAADSPAEVSRYLGTAEPQARRP
ncbi:pentapeptide repeat-containing protein [Amycolatopsis sp. NPDC059020]|uniref:pentapeptide repeat-containing protein n=1 Tax=unclassified Amycolatopsis TaxID=2618356 RepID=UPI00366A6852